MLTDIQKKELAENHWIYTVGLLAKTNEPATEREHYLYVQAMIHGIKHGEKEKQMALIELDDKIYNHWKDAFLTDTKIREIANKWFTTAQIEIARDFAYHVIGAQMADVKNKLIPYILKGQKQNDK